ncbi:hypothetical protein [Paenibacillus chibensis]|uniref:hypothetical protein n=1 Tax=Paenibacillus chibensis TaxID=59846 RepID=UPI000FDB80D8|nr:hypothetical protein [Paenibacillus chibensis]MEC0369287.1 hypothetical protein [Paenibacillus chibensis]
MNKWMLLTLVFLFILGGCGGKKAEGISKEDLGIIKMNGGKKVYYGMSREDAEKVLGSGENSDMGMFKYDGGVSVFYRNGNVAAVVLDAESKGKYKTTHDVQIGMPKQTVVKAYGDKYMSSPSESNLDYVYDTNTNKFMDGYSRIIAKDADKFYTISSMFDENGNLQRMLLLDCSFAIFLQ